MARGFYARHPLASAEARSATRARRASEVPARRLPPAGRSTGILDEDVDRDLDFAGQGVAGLEEDLAVERPGRDPRRDRDEEPVKAPRGALLVRDDLGLERRRLVDDLELRRALAPDHDLQLRFRPLATRNVGEPQP